ncbi:MAG TPA: DUF4388 domain-containing protein [Thermoanaerobaculia bacterium]|nr:DUF4388 domain-containing protein [Thermoanaerobaculia bacterium]
MSGQPPNPELDEALLELQQYLSDSLPPLVVADSVQLLMKYPPDVVANAIRAWTGAQYRRGAAEAVPVSDYLYHTLKKIHMMAEFKLVPREPLEVYLAGLRPLIVALCPAEDRAMLVENLGRLGEAPASSSISQAQTIFRQAPAPGSAPRATASGGGSAGGGAAASGGGSAGAAAGAGPSEAAVRGLHRFSLLLERLDAQGGLAPLQAGAAGIAAPGPGNAVAIPAGAGEALAFAARSSQTGQELDAYLARLREMGVEAGTDSVFRALSQSLPGWVVPALPAAAGAAAPESGALGAMRRIITDSEDPVETGKRFQEMVRAGIERFNEGSLPQSVAMLELAEKLTSEKRVDAGTVELVRRRLGDSLDGEQLRKFTEKPDQHALLRKVLQFFTAFRPEGLLEELRREQKRDRRRLILALLEAHGAPARAAAYEELSRAPSRAVDEEEWFFRRNLVYLLRRIPRSADATFEDESEVVVRHAQLGLPLLLVKEAIATLAQYKDERAEQGLTQLLFELEGMLGEKPGETLYEAKDLRGLLDRVAATLGKFPAPRARRALIEHAGKKQPPLGDAMARIAELGSQDMSDDTETVDQLLELLKANLPFKLLGMTLRQNDQNLVRVIEALGSTPTPAVRRHLQEIASRFGGQDAGRAAQKALAGFDRPKPEAAGTPAGTEPAATSPEPAAASLQGDLEVFGLPALLQSLAESSASGSLTLRGPKGGDVFAAIALRDGKLTDIRRGRLSGEDAFYQLFERPLPGQFAFVKGAPADSGAPPREILPLTLEAMRRYDELQEAEALVPDAARFEKTEVAATPLPGEKDGSFLQAVWERASQGGTALDCEAAVASDSYRIRRALAHWVEIGALRIQGKSAG